MNISVYGGEIIVKMSRFGKTKIGAHMMTMRELSAHTGELNKMLIENGLDDIWR